MESSSPYPVSVSYISYHSIIHYYTTEAKALFSLASVSLMYSPIGLLIWSIRGSPSGAFFLALVVASFIETGKLFLQGLHPDPTNVLLGAVAAWGTVHLATVLAKAANAPTTVVPAEMHATELRSLDKSATSATKNRWKNYAALLLPLSFAGYWAATFPTQPVLLCLFLAACAAIVWQRPALFLVIISGSPADP